MNLYYAITNYHLLCSILHALIYHSGEKNILYISNYHSDFIELQSRLKKSKLFFDVKVFEEVLFPSGNKKVNSKQIFIDIEKIVKKIPNNFRQDVVNAKNIYICGDDYSCSVYLVYNKINYNYIEEACGVLSDEDRLLRIIKKIDYSRYQIIKKLGLIGNNKYIKNRYGDLSNQLAHYQNDKDVHFSVKESLFKISDSDKKKIIDIFSDSEIDVPSNALLLLTFHYVNMNLLTFNEQIMLYNLLLDYFGEKYKLVIKAHPSDIQVDYKEWFPDAIVLPRTLPSELLPILSDSKYSKILTAYSTAIFALQNYARDLIHFNCSIENKFFFFNLYYFSLKLINSFNLDDFEVCFVNMDDSMIKNICKQEEINLKEEHYYSSFLDLNNSPSLKRRIIVADLSQEDILVDECDDILIAFNMSSDFEFNKLKKMGTMFYIEKTVINNNLRYLEEQMEDEFMFVYGLSNSDYLLLLNNSYSKKLYYSNIAMELKMNFAEIALLLSNKNTMLRDNQKQLQEKLNKISLEKEIIVEQNNIKNKAMEIENISLRDELNKYMQKYETIVNSSSWKITKVYRNIGGYLKKIKKGRFFFYEK